MKEDSSKSMNSLKTKSLTSVIWKFSERIMAKFVSLFVAIILARLLTPEDYSATSIVSIFFVFANVFISGGFNMALIQKKDADEEDYSSVLFLSMAIAAIMYVVLFFAAPTIASVYDQPVLVSVIRVMGIVLFVNAINSIVSAKISRDLDFKKYFFATLGGTLFSAIVGITMAYNGFGCWALVAQQMCNTIVDTIILVVVSKIKIVPRISFSRLKILFNYGSKIFLASLISVIYDEINPLIIGLRYSGADLAFYSKGRSFPAIVHTTVGDTFSAVFFPVATKLQGSAEQMLNATRRYMSLSSFVIFPSMLGFLAVAESFVKVILTDKWIPATIYIQLFSIVYMLNIIQKGNIQVIQASGRSDLILKMEIIKKSLYFIVIALFVMFSDQPYMLAVACLINTLIATVVNTFPNRSIIGYSYWYQIKDVGVNLCISVIMAVIVLLVGKINGNPIIVLVIQILTGVVVYIGINIVVKNKDYYYFLNTIKQLVNRKKGKS